jgi:hypothetical protein
MMDFTENILKHNKKSICDVSAEQNRQSAFAPKDATK